MPILTPVGYNQAWTSWIRFLIICLGETVSGRYSDLGGTGGDASV